MLEAELTVLLHRCGDAAWVVSEDGTIRSWNPVATRLLGYDEQEVVGRDVHDVLQARDGLGTAPLAAGPDSAVRQVGDAREPIRDFDIEVRTRDGRRVWLNVSTIVVERERRRPPLIVRLARDVTARKAQERLLGRLIPLARQLAALADPLPAPAPVAPLTDRERRILHLFEQGASSVEVERALGITAQTLRNHVHRINRKLRTRTRLEAVAHARRRGLID